MDLSMVGTLWLFATAVLLQLISWLHQIRCLRKLTCGQEADGEFGALSVEIYQWQIFICLAQAAYGYKHLAQVTEILALVVAALARVLVGSFIVYLIWRLNPMRLREAVLILVGCSLVVGTYLSPWSDYFLTIISLTALPFIAFQMYYLWSAKSVTATSGWVPATALLVSAAYFVYGYKLGVWPIAVSAGVLMSVQALWMGLWLRYWPNKSALPDKERSFDDLLRKDRAAPAGLKELVK